METLNLFELFARIILDTSDYDDNLDEASRNTESFADKLKNGLSTAAKVGAAALTAAASGVAALTKSSIDQYAEYEQLVGGVDTLFKDASDTIQQYASNAYKTAGVSANTYMEQATAFSASLIQSLGGDTQAAAEYANQAIMDMSDNANKMGTDIESIQQTYQSLMRGNYAMLDNLKLGYGGTKSELERLVADAEKLTGQALDPAKFSDVITAIHAVQDNLGITGTTAKEAATTIEGSIGMMKAAWDNLLVGIANENGDLGSLIYEFADTVKTAASNILPRVEIILGGISQLIADMGPIIAQALPDMISAVLPSLISAGAQLLVGLVTGLVSAVPQLVAAVPGIVNSLVSTISANFPALSAAGSDLLTMFSNGIVSGIPAMLVMLPDVITAIYTFLKDNLPKWIESGVELLENLAFGILEAIPDMVAKLPEVISAIAEYFTTAFPVIVKKGGELLGQLLVGIIGAIPEIALQLPAVITAIVEALEAGWETIKDAGKYLLEGLWAGISDKVQWLKDKVSGVVDTIKSWFTGSDGFDEHSPSKWAKQVFRYVMEGGGQGLEAGLPDLMSDVQNVTNRVKNGMNFGTANVDFASSGLGMASAGMVNGIASAVNSGVSNITLTANLMFPDGTKLATYQLPFLINAGRAAGTPIANPQVG